MTMMDVEWPPCPYCEGKIERTLSNWEAGRPVFRCEGCGEEFVVEVILQKKSQKSQTKIQ